MDQTCFHLRQISQVRDTFIKFKPHVENRFSSKIGTLFSDNGGEFIALRSFLSTHGISHLTSPPHTPEHNGLAERRHRHIVETGLALLTHSQIPTTYWSYAFATTVFLINRMPTPILSFQSPYQKLFAQTPNYNKLKVFGSLCFPWLKPYNSHKLHPKSLPCVFLGYSLTQSAYLCLEPKSHRIYVSLHVVFDETKFPFQSFSMTLSNSVDDSQSPSSSAPPHTIIHLSSPPFTEAPSQSLESTMAPLSSDSSPPLGPSDNSNADDTTAPTTSRDSVNDSGFSVHHDNNSNNQPLNGLSPTSPTLSQQAQQSPSQTEAQNQSPHMSTSLAPKST